MDTGRVAKNELKILVVETKYRSKSNKSGLYTRCSEGHLKVVSRILSVVGAWELLSLVEACGEGKVIHLATWRTEKALEPYPCLS